MAKVPKGVETLTKISIAWVGWTNVTDDRQTTDGRTMTYSEREREMTHVYVAVMVELLATLPYVLYLDGNTTNALPLLSTTAPVLSCSMSTLQHAMVGPYLARPTYVRKPLVLLMRFYRTSNLGGLKSTADRNVYHQRFGNCLSWMLPLSNFAHPSNNFLTSEKCKMWLL